MENELLTLKKELEEKLNECQKEADVLNQIMLVKKVALPKF